MKISELEVRLREHAEITKSIITPPFDIEREELNMSKRYDFTRIALIAAVILVLAGTTVFASYRLLGAKDAVNTIGDTKLAQYFEKQGNVSDTVTDGAYKATVLGIVSGENLSSFKSSSWEIFPERTYAVTAIEKTDGSEMTYDDEILVTPLIEGLSPWQYNIFTMNGSYTADIIDGVLYRIIEVDSIEYFADRNVYMAIVSDGFLNNKQYTYDEATGTIEPKEDYDGTNILIKLPFDKSKANPQKAAEYLNKLNEDMKESEDTENTEDTENVTEVVITDEMLEKGEMIEKKVYE